MMITKILNVFRSILKAKIVLPMHEVVTSSTPLSPGENIPQKPKRLKHARLKKLGDKRVPKNDKPISNKPASFTSGSKRTSNTQDTLEKVKKVDQLRQQQKINIEDACKQVGISAGYYYKLRSK
jgi:hypothetical protein